MYLNDMINEWDYSLMELLNYLDLSYDDYLQLKIINAPLDRRTINFIKAIKIIYENDKRTRYMRVCTDNERYIMPFEKLLIRGCAMAINRLMTFGRVLFECLQATIL